MLKVRPTRSAGREEFETVAQPFRLCQGSADRRRFSGGWLGLPWGGAEAFDLHRGSRAYNRVMSEPEVWLRGPIDGVPSYLQPVAHSLLQSREEVAHVLAGVKPESIWYVPANAASVGFHVLHAIGSLDRLFTYARGSALSDAQRQALTQESQPQSDLTADDLVAAFGAAIEQALHQLRGTDQSTLTVERHVGRARLPSTVIGLLFHAAEHTQRHTGQALTTSRMLSSREE